MHNTHTHKAKWTRRSKKRKKEDKPTTTMSRCPPRGLLPLKGTREEETRGSYEQDATRNRDKINKTKQHSGPAIFAKNKEKRHQHEEKTPQPKAQVNRMDPEEETKHQPQQRHPRRPIALEGNASGKMGEEREETTMMTTMARTTIRKRRKRQRR